MPRSSDPNEIPERLAQAGQELFLSQGYNATGIQQIANRAGVPKGSFYNHYASKDLFAAAIVDRYAQQAEKGWARIMECAPKGAMDSIRHLFTFIIRHYEDERQQKGCLVGNFAAEIASSSELCRERLIAAQDSWRERLANLIKRGQKEGDIRTDIDAWKLSTLTWNIWEGAILQMKMEQSTTPLKENMFLFFERFYGVENEVTVAI